MNLQLLIKQMEGSVRGAPKKSAIPTLSDADLDRLDAAAYAWQLAASQEKCRRLDERILSLKMGQGKSFSGVNIREVQEND
jgi:hypothetical protein